MTEKLWFDDANSGHLQPALSKLPTQLNVTVIMATGLRPNVAGWVGLPYWSLIRRLTGPNPRINVVVDLRNKETLNSFSYAHAVRSLRNSTSDHLD